MNKNHIFTIVLLSGLITYVTSFARDPVFTTTKDNITVVLPEIIEEGEEQRVVFNEHQYNWDLKEVGKDEISALSVHYPGVFSEHTSSHYELVSGQINSLKSAFSLKNYITVSAIERVDNIEKFDREDKQFDYTERVFKVPIENLISLRDKEYIQDGDRSFDKGLASFYTNVRTGSSKKDYSNTSRYVTFDKEFNVKKIESADFNYLRSHYSVDVFSDKNKRKGELHIYGRQPFVSKKKQDPNVLSYDLVYLDGEGNKVFQKPFVFGKKKNSLQVKTAYIKNQQLMLLCENVKKSSIGVIGFDFEGNEVSRSPFVEIYDMKSRVASNLPRNDRQIRSFGFDDWNISYIEHDDAQNTYLIGQFEKSKWVGEDTMRKQLFSYGDLFIIKLNAQQEIITLSLFEQWNDHQDFVADKTQLFPVKISNEYLVVLAQKLSGQQPLRLLKVSVARQPEVSQPLGDSKGLYYTLDRVK